MRPTAPAAPPATATAAAEKAQPSLRPSGPRVAFATGPVSIPPTYFAIQHARLLGPSRAHLFSPLADLSGAQGRERAELERLVTSAIPEEAARRTPARLLPYRVQAALPRTARLIEGSRPDLVHQHFATSSLPAAHAAHRLGVPLLTTLHGVDAFALCGGKRGPWGVLERASLRAASRSDRLLAVSEYLAAESVRLGWPEDRVRVHYQGVDTGFFAPASDGDDAGARGAEDQAPGARSPQHAVDLPGDSPIVLFVGGLVPIKGIEDLLAASELLGSLVPHRLVLVGDGPLAGAVDAAGERAREAGRSTITRVRGAGREAVRAWMRAASAVVLPSVQWQGRAEAAGLVLLEAQACGTPVVTNDSGGKREMLSPACAGSVARSGDAASLAQAVEGVLGLPESERDRLGAEARDWVVRNRSLTASLAALEAHWAEALA